MCPCKGCEKRLLGCHASCEAYAEYKKTEAEKKEWLREKNRNLQRRSFYTRLIYGEYEDKRICKRCY